jgi:hypothetical protein
MTNDYLFLIVKLLVHVVYIQSVARNTENIKSTRKSSLIAEVKLLTA